MKIAILHHDLEDSEKKMQELLVEGGILVKMLDVREASIEDFYDVSFVLNRVYASVANRDYSSISKTLALLKALEEKNIKCLNSYLTTFYDYSKYDSYKNLIFLFLNLLHIVSQDSFQYFQINHPHQNLF